MTNRENTIDLVGRIADRGYVLSKQCLQENRSANVGIVDRPEAVNAREWMRICFELLDMLKAHVRLFLFDFHS